MEAERQGGSWRDSLVGKWDGWNQRRVSLIEKARSGLTGAEKRELAVLQKIVQVLMNRSVL